MGTRPGKARPPFSRSSATGPRPESERPPRDSQSAASPLLPALGPASPAAHPKRPEKKDCEFFTLRSASASSAIASACFPEVSMTSRSCSAQAPHRRATTHRPGTPRTLRSDARWVTSLGDAPRDSCGPTSGLRAAERSSPTTPPPAKAFRPLTPNT